MHRTRRALLLGTLTMSATTAIAAQTDTPPGGAAVVSAAAPAGLAARRVSGSAPDIDGRLDDAVWAEGLVPAVFRQREPDPGAPARFTTAVAVRYDETSLYVAMRLYDTAPDSIASQLSRRDERGGYSDWAHVYVDSYDDRRTAFRFSVNPHGVKLDALHFDDTMEDVAWDAVWDAAAHVDAEGWVAEFRIPLSQLRYAGTPEDGEHSWGVNFGRETARLGEVSFWSPVPADGSRFVSSFGRLTGLAGLPSPGRLEVRPYTLSRVTRAPALQANPLRHGTTLDGTAGMDVRYGVTSDLTLDLAVNPDFGQVEADPSVINLSAFETFLPERRPFFVKGTDLFNLTFPQWPPLFYPRRIGRAPQGGLPAGAQFTDAPTSTTILGAAKLTGKTAGGTSVAVLSAVTAEESGRFLMADGAAGDAVIEPATVYSVGRVIQDFRNGESAIGAIVTATNRRLADGGPMFLHRAAYTGGIDGRHRFGGAYEISGSLIGSHVRGSPDALRRTQQLAGRYLQRPDATHLDYDPDRTTLAGSQASLRLAKVSGRWQWELSGTQASPGFEINDLGFQNWRVDNRNAFGRVSYVRPEPGGPFRSLLVHAHAAGTWTTGGERTDAWAQVSASVEFHNRWRIRVGLDRTLPGLSPDQLRGGPALRMPGYVASWLGWESDPRSTVGIGGWSFMTAYDEGTGYSISFSPSLTYRASTRLNLSLGPNVTRRSYALQYLATRPDTVTGADEYLFGRIRQTTAVLTARVNYTVNPDLSIQAYAQPFVSAGRYDRIRHVSDPRADDPAARFTPATLDGTPDFTFRQFRSTVVLRYEYRPGSTVFLVWGQDRTSSGDSGRLQPGRDLRELFGGAGRNVLLLKVDYWIGR